MGQAESTSPADATASGGTLKKIALVLIALGGVLSLLAFLDEGGRTRFGYAYLFGFLFCWAIVLGSLFFVALQHVTSSVWSVVMRRVAEMLAAPVWLLALLFIPLLVFVLLNKELGIFPWLRAKGDHILEDKAPYLNDTFFIVRTVVFFVVWIAFAAFFVRGSINQDAEGEGRAEGTKRMRNVSGPFIILFAFTLTFASFDWVMSLEPHWFSTIYGVYVFSGIFLSGLAAITIAVLWLRKDGRPLGNGLVTKNHLYSLGGLLFAFTCFWGYIAFSQFMLIWYGNLPEETVYYVKRMKNGWLTISYALVFLRFALPFFLLLARGSKMDPKRLMGVSILVLVGQLVDLYWLIMPSQADAPLIGWQEIGPAAFFIGVLMLYVGVFLGRHKAVATGDPLYEQSRNFHL